MFPKSPPGTKRTGKNMRGPHIKQLSHMHGTGRVQELCKSRGGRPGLSVLRLTVSVDVKQHWTMLRHWSQFAPNMSTDIRGYEALSHHCHGLKTPSYLHVLSPPHASPAAALRSSKFTWRAFVSHTEPPQTFLSLSLLCVAWGCGVSLASETIFTLYSCLFFAPRRLHISLHVLWVHL